MENILNQLDESMNLQLLNYKATSLLKEFIMNISDDDFIVYEHSIVVNSRDKTAHGYIILIPDKIISDSELKKIFGDKRYINQGGNVTIYLDYTEAELLSHNDAVSSIRSAFDYAVNCLDGLDAYSDAAYEIENTLKLYEK